MATMSAGEVFFVVAAIYGIVFFVHVISDVGRHVESRNKRS